MPNEPILLNNGWLAGTQVPSSCSVGNSPNFYNEINGQLYTCVNGQYTSVTGGAAVQTPWVQQVDAAGFALVNVNAVYSNDPVNSPNRTLTLQPAGLQYQFGPNLRWNITVGGNETGGNTGSDFSILRYPDGPGGPLGIPIAIIRSNGQLVLSTGTGGLLVQDNASSTKMTITPAGAVSFNSLPSANPGAGSKQLWYDPADSNRVKYAA